MRPGPAGPGNRHALERRMILDVVRRLAVRDLPHEIALVHVERGDAPVRRLDERQPLHVERRRAAAFRRRRRLVDGDRRRHAGRSRIAPGRRAAGSSASGRRRRIRIARGAREVREVAPAAVVLHQPQRRRRRRRVDVEHLGFGIERRAVPVHAAAGRRQHQRRERRRPRGDDRRREDRTDLVARRQLHRFGLQLGREVDEVVERDALAIERRRLGDEGLRRRIPLAGDVALLDRHVLRSATPAVP